MTDDPLRRAIQKRNRDQSPEPSVVWRRRRLILLALHEVSKIFLTTKANAVRQPRPGVDDRQRGVPKAEDLDPSANRAVEEYLATLDDAAFGAATPVEPKFISPVDPAARWTASWGGPAVYGYCTNYLVDVQHAVFVDVEPSTAVRQAEVTAAKTMIERVHDRLALWPERLVADTG